MELGLRAEGWELAGTLAGPAQASPDGQGVVGNPPRGSQPTWSL